MYRAAAATAMSSSCGAASASERFCARGVQAASCLSWLGTVFCRVPPVPSAEWVQRVAMRIQPPFDVDRFPAQPRVDGRLAPLIEALDLFIDPFPSRGKETAIGTPGLRPCSRAKTRRQACLRARRALLACRTAQCYRRQDSASAWPREADRQRTRWRGAACLPGKGCQPWRS